MLMNPNLSILIKQVIWAGDGQAWLFTQPPELWSSEDYKQAANFFFLRLVIRVKLQSILGWTFLTDPWEGPFFS